MENTAVAEINETTSFKLYSKRWWVIICTGIEVMLSEILRGSFGIVNDVYVVYFNVSYETVDWFTLITIPGTMLLSLVLGLILFYKLVVIRKLALLMATCLVLIFICLLSAYVYTPLYPLILVGQFLLGFVVVAIDALSTSFAVSWFPENQMGIAISSKEVGSSIGSLLGFLIPSNILISPSYSKSLNHSALDNYKHPSTDDDWFAKDQVRLIIFASVLLFIAVLTTIFYIVFIEDKPPTPPTAAQAVSPADEQDQRNFDTNSIKELYTLFKKVTFSKLFMQAIFILSAAVGCNILMKLYIGEILRHFFIDLGYFESPDVMAGYALILFEVGCILGAFLSGVVVNHIKDYQMIIVFDLICYLISSICFTLGYYFYSIPVVYFFSTCFGICLASLGTPIYESVFQHFFPMDTGLLAVIIRVEYAVSYLILGVLGRKILKIFHQHIAVFVFMCILISLALIVSLFFKPKYNRLEAGTENTRDVNSNEAENERSALLTESK